MVKLLQILFSGSLGQIAFKLDIKHRVLEKYHYCSNDLALTLTIFCSKVKYREMLEHQILWKHLKICALKCSDDDLWLNLTFLWQAKIRFLGFYMRRVHRTHIRF